MRKQLRVIATDETKNGNPFLVTVDTDAAEDSIDRVLLTNLTAGQVARIPVRTILDVDVAEWARSEPGENGSETTVRRIRCDVEHVHSISAPTVSGLGDALASAGL
jgi:hypothetical protein